MTRYPIQSKEVILGLIEVCAIANSAHQRWNEARLSLLDNVDTLTRKIKFDESSEFYKEDCSAIEYEKL